MIAAEPAVCLVLSEEDFSGLLVGHRSIATSFLAHLSGLLRRQEDAEWRERLEAQEAVMVSLAALTEHRDENTGAHLERIRHYCAVLTGAASREGTSGEEVDKEFVSWIFLESPLHDIGKVGVPDEVLLMQGRLNESGPLVGREVDRERLSAIIDHLR